MAERSTGKYVGSAFITMNREIGERLWKRVQGHAGPAPKARCGRRRNGQARGIGRVKHLRGEEKLRHASLEDFWED
jgi:bifunctional non-homologous end joining protein LigD